MNILSALHPRLIFRTVIFTFGKGVGKDAGTDGHCFVTFEMGARG
jgi:hypothetical protein